MTISVGNTLPEATMLQKTNDTIGPVDLKARLAGRKVVIFGVPGAFTPTCDVAHLPSFIRTKDELAAKGVDEIICISVNDPHVMKFWGETSGATEAGITMLADADAAYTTAIGMRFDAPPVGLIARSKRYSMLVDDGIVKILNLETERGVCNLSGGENMLDQI